MSPLAWFLLANTVATMLAVVLGLGALLVESRHAHHARKVVQAVEGLILDRGQEVVSVPTLDPDRPFPPPEPASAVREAEQHAEHPADPDFLLTFDHEPDPSVVREAAQRFVASFESECVVDEPDQAVTAELLTHIESTRHTVHVDPHPSGRHALVEVPEPLEATAAMWPDFDEDVVDAEIHAEDCDGTCDQAGQVPCWVGEARVPVPPYYFAAQKGESR